MLRLSKRLQAIANLVPTGARLADIGSDHAKLPLALLGTERISFAVAGEVARGPYEIARKRSAGLIQVRLADGLAAISAADQIDTVVIAGMGGLLICQILAAGQDKLQTVKQLILQPNKNEPEVRAWLRTHSFDIANEEIVEEDGHFYEILLAEKGSADRTAEEFQFGPRLLQQRSAIFLQKWEKVRDKKQKILSNLPPSSADLRQELEIEIKAIERILNR